MREKFHLYLDLIRWNRPAGWLLLLWPTLTALWLAAGGFPGWHLLFVFTAGTILMRSAGCCINDVADRNFDRHVKRTAERPITSGKISVQEALLVGAALALAALALALTTHPAVWYWTIPALAITIAYPFAKRYVSMPQAILGIAFSMGLPMAYAAVQHQIPWVVALMLIANLCWVLAYDTEYAMVDRDDDLKIGMKTSAITLGDKDVPAIMGFYAIHTVIWWGILWGTMPTSPSAGQVLWWCLTLSAVLWQMLWHWRLIRTRQRDTCFKAFTQNHWIGFVVFIAAVGLA